MFICILVIFRLLMYGKNKISFNCHSLPLFRLMVPGSPATNNSGNFSSIFGNRMKKGKFDQCAMKIRDDISKRGACKCLDVKRAESMKADAYKKPKRTPSFTTRRRTQSFRKLQKLENLDQLPPVEIQGFLDRKHELQSSGKKAAVRSWKTFYTGERDTVFRLLIFVGFQDKHIIGLRDAHVHKAFI